MVAPLITLALSAVLAVCVFRFIDRRATRRAQVRRVRIALDVADPRPTVAELRVRCRADKARYYPKSPVGAGVAPDAARVHRHHGQAS